MLCYLDRTFCCNPDCDNSCNRKLTDHVREAAKEAGLPLSLSDFHTKDINYIENNIIDFPKTNY